MSGKKQRKPHRRLSALERELFSEAIAEVRDAVKKDKPFDFGKLQSPEAGLYELLLCILKLVHLRKKNRVAGGLTMNYHDIDQLGDVFTRMLGDVTIVLAKMAKPPYEPQAMLKACVAAWQQNDTSEILIIVQILKARLVAKKNPTTTAVPQVSDIPLSARCRAGNIRKVLEAHERGELRKRSDFKMHSPNQPMTSLIHQVKMKWKRDPALKNEVLITLSKIQKALSE